MGPGSLWAAAIDSDSGLAAVCGWVEGEVRQLNPVQERDGGGKDALLAVFRLWKPLGK